MKLTRLRVLLMLVLAVTSSSLLVWHFTSASPSPSIGRTVTPGAIGPCTWFVSVDGTTPVAEAMVGGLSVSPGDNLLGTAGEDFATFVNSFIAASQTICFGPGSYTLANQSPPSGWQAGLIPNVGIILKNNDEIRGAGNNTIFTTGAIGNPCGVCDYFAAFVNANPSTGNTGITVRDIYINLPFPTQTGGGLNNWDDGIVFEGAHNSYITHVNVMNGNLRVRADSTYITTPNGLLLGQNFQNLISYNIINNETASSELFVSTNSTFAFNIIHRCWDDCLLMGSADQGSALVGNYIDNTAVVAGKGGSSGCIRLQNDGAVSMINGMTDIVINDNVMFSDNLGSGSRNGLYIGFANRVTVAGNTIKLNAGFGISIEGSNATSIVGNNIFNNLQGGIQYISTTNSVTIYDLTISANNIYDNTNHGINIAPNAATRAIQDVVISNNDIWDDGKGGGTQTNGIRFGTDGTTTNVMITGNNLVRSPTPVAYQGAGTLKSVYFVGNQGYNPIGKVTNFVVTGTAFAPWGSASAVVASTDYTVWGAPAYFTSSGGTGVSITIKDAAGNTVYAPGASLATPFEVVYGDKINFGAFSVAPTVTVWFA